ncbi:unnamed protein product [Sphacelaria rigidula]
MVSILFKFNAPSAPVEVHCGHALPLQYANTALDLATCILHASKSGQQREGMCPCAAEIHRRILFTNDSKFFSHGDVPRIHHRRCTFGVCRSRFFVNRGCGMCWAGWRWEWCRHFTTFPEDTE